MICSPRFGRHVPAGTIMRIARIVGLIGRGLVVAGLLLLFYTAYLLVGTNVLTKNIQKHLEKQLETSSPVQNQVVAGEIKPAVPATPPKLGDPLFTIVIPKIGLKTIVVEGAKPNDERAWQQALRGGPGHFTGYPYPGQDGNVPLSGHRTTFGAPFFRLNELQPGDRVAIESGQVRFNYTVTEQKVVDDSETRVIENHGRNELTLATCHPRYSAAQRLIVHAQYDGPELIQAASAPVTADPGIRRGAPTLVPAPPPAIPRDTLVLALMSAIAMLSAMALSKTFRPAAIWSTFTISAGIGLWTAVFPQLLRLMPANY